MEQAIRTPRTAHTARPVTSSSGRFVRLGTVSWDSCLFLVYVVSCTVSIFFLFLVFFFSVHVLNNKELTAFLLVCVIYSV